MMVLSILLLLMIGCLAGCGGKNRSPQAESDQSHAAIYYNDQEFEKRRLDATGITVRHQKEIDVDNIDIEQINYNYDYVWTVDIPVPIDAVEKRNYCKATFDVYTVGYTVSEAQEDLVPFYKRQMELLGWQGVWETEGLEALLMFEKSHKHCAVSIRPGSSRKKTDIIIMQKIV